MLTLSLAFLLPRQRILAALCGGAVALAPAGAAAASPPLVATEQAQEQEGVVDAPVETVEPKLSYWADSKPRWFAAGRLEGGLYLKPQFFLGYGQPHWIWGGLEAYPIVTFAFAGAYAGLRFSLPILDVKLGVRNSASFDRSYLTPKADYVASDVDHVHDHARAEYTTVEGTISGVLPLPGSYLVAGVDAYYLPAMPKGLDMYEEALRVVTRAPWLVGTKLAYAVRIGKNGFIKAGVLGELVTVPSRGAVTWRVGPAAIVNLTDHIDALVALSVPVSSTDRLGIVQGSFGVLGVSYAWATGDERPHLPSAVAVVSRTTSLAP
jgi:hypothetical protein